MTEETPGFDEQPDVPPSSTPFGEEGPPSSAQGPGPQAPDEAKKAGGPAGSAGPAGPSGDDLQTVGLQAQLDQVRTALNERTADLQRVQAEYQNYRRRVERDRITVKEIAAANLLTELLPVLDDIGRAREHGELLGGFKSVAESLETIAAKMGLQQFGKDGEPFDPLIHEALMHSYAPDVTETTCVSILQPGYRIGERTIRPARVAVAEPQPGAQQKGGADGDTQSADEDSSGPDEG
ncbi:nucleotide exchange factor GrpE [Streptomyces sp. NPDC048639]|uniref:nucleotide exchange factor GrpE n=1 Tax=Streptomyces sp. NPDC048639 TaxID=3365581 RepID=UPI003717EBD7